MPEYTTTGDGSLMNARDNDPASNGDTGDLQSGQASDTSLLDDGSLADSALVDHEAAELTRLHGKKRRKRLLGLLGVTVIGAIGFSLWPSTQIVTKTPLDLTDDAKFEYVLRGLDRDENKRFHAEDFVVTQTMLSKVVDHQEIETLILDSGIVDDKTVSALTPLKELQHLRLRLSPIGDDGMKEIAKLESLWFLNLPHSVCSSKGVSELRSLPRLRQLRLGSPNLGNEVTREIAEIKTLRGIHLIDIPVTNDGLKSLASLPYLESLYLDGSAVTETGWRWLYSNYPQLHVHVDQQHNDYDPKAHSHHEDR